MYLAMRRLGRFLLCLLSLSMLTTTLVHALEVPSAPTIECSGYVHSDGDMDQDDVRDCEHEATTNQKPLL